MAESPSYGGQAVIEGVVMRGPEFVSMSVREPGGGIVSFVKRVYSPSQRHALMRLPIVRGAFAFWDSLSIGIQMLMKSADISFPEEKPSGTAANLSVALAAVIAVSAFIVLPAAAAPLLLRALNITGRLASSLVETLIRVAVLVGYVASISRMKEIQRVLQYHGAEHKVIWAWEKHHREINEKIYLEKWGVSQISEFLASKAQRESPLHPRCGTSFLFIAVLVTWLVFLFVSPESTLERVAVRLLLMPVAAGMSYEVLKASAAHGSAFWRVIKAPGMGLQSLTTKEPDAGQLEVAADSLARLVEAERGGFR